MKSNPFATRFVAPGRLPWLPLQGLDLPQLVRRFREDLNSCAAIVGPHGSGKSTLLEHLVPRLGRIAWRDASSDVGLVAAPAPSPPTLLATTPASIPSAGTSPGRAARDASEVEVVWLRLRRGSGPLRRIVASRTYWRAGGLLVVDGWEQLLPTSRIIVGAIAKRDRVGMLVTSHRRGVLLPTLVATDPDAETVRDLVIGVLDRHPNLSAQARMELAASPRIARLLSEELGNVREVFMRLFDHYEELVDGARSPSSTPPSVPSFSLSHDSNDAHHGHATDGHSVPSGARRPSSGERRGDAAG